MKLKRIENVVTTPRQLKQSQLNNAIATDGWSRTNAGVGFAIPINQTKRIIEDFEK